MSKSQAESSTGEMNPNQFRRDLVQILFGLTVAQIVVFGANLLEIDPLFSIDKIPSATHLTLAFFVVWASWFGWRTSLLRRPMDESKFLGKSSLIAILDIVLVFWYLLLTRSMEMSDVGVAKTENDAVLTAPSACPEAALMTLIFLTYVLWDVVAEWGKPFSCGSEDKRFKVPWPSLVSVGLAAVVICVAPPKGDPGGMWGVVCCDIALVWVVFLFRSLKEDQSKRIEGCERKFGLSITLLVLYAVSLMYPLANLVLRVWCSVEPAVEVGAAFV